MTLPGTARSPTSTRSVIALLGTVALTVFFPFSIRLAQGTVDQSQTELPYLRIAGLHLLSALMLILAQSHPSSPF
jgi:hypothetical protein